ncbi:hypothetical protein Sru01_08260 [Sphaerisporangium rufum]|uniref:BP74 N-terminal domain-containing protein n=2 Tax=Sphaerisporangium rufum TaxID=1381558 RepID=A0A919QXD8_9ACTN|nr:hypothetical protein Sru01_08260 [Sphaerisporangium rufum]
MVTLLLTALLAMLALPAMAGSAAAAAAGGTGPAAAENEAYFAFDYPPSRETVVIKLTDPEKIQHARDLLAGKTQDRPHVMGRLVKRPEPYNPGWSFHLDPATISFFQVAIEVCDASPHYVEEHLDEAGGAFLPGLYWCPWGSRLVREVPKG